MKPFNGRQVAEWLLYNSLYWTIRNWFRTRRIARKNGLKNCSGLFIEREIKWK